MFDLLIIGAGPAGLNAAASAGNAGLKVIVLDEFPKAGGRLLGQLYQKPDGEWWNGVELGETLKSQALEAGVDINCGTSVYDIEKLEDSWIVYTNHGDYRAENLLLATGSSEKAIPVPGWTLPGVMTIGAAQVMGNVHRVKPGDSCVVIGVNVLSISIAHELSMCGINVREIILPEKSIFSKSAGEPAAVLDALMKLTHLAPQMILRKLGALGSKLSPKFAIHFYPKKGVKMFGIPIKIKTVALEILGDEEATGVRVAEVDSSGKLIKKSERVIEADFVCLAGGLSPLVELASLVGCEFIYSESFGGHVPKHCETMETNIPGLFVAGSITGVESANVAMAQGTLAGLSIAGKGKTQSEKIDKQIAEAQSEVAKVRKEALIQFQPGIIEEREKYYRQEAII